MYYDILIYIIFISNEILSFFLCPLYMLRYFAILIDGDLENSLGGACSRDIWNITQKLLKDLPIEKDNIYTFFHNFHCDSYAKKLASQDIENISESNITNIKKCFDEVISLAKEDPMNVCIYFHYSGHGYQLADQNGDEIDGFDDIFLGHTMTDDYIWDNLISQLPSNAHIFILLDACHSGSGADMPYKWKNNRWELAKRNNIAAKCIGYSISACNDKECASQDVGETTGFAGSLTAGICDKCNFSNLIHNPIPTYNILVDRLRKLNQTVELYSVNIC